MKTTDEVVHEVRLAGQVGEYGQAIRELAEERDRLWGELGKAHGERDNREAERNEAMVLLRSLEWTEEEVEPGWACPKCHQWKRDGHAGDCALSNFLKGLTSTTAPGPAPQRTAGESALDDILAKANTTIPQISILGPTGSPAAPVVESDIADIERELGDAKRDSETHRAGCNCIFCFSRRYDAEHRAAAPAYVAEGTDGVE